MEPSGPTLLRLEQQARRAGTGLGAADLNGRWQLQQVWPKAGQHPSTLSSQLLRSLNARLEISDGGEDLTLCNTVTLSLLELRFHGRVVLTLAGRPRPRRRTGPLATGRRTRSQTLNRNSITSPSATTYSLPSLRSQPFERASTREPASSSWA